jgi:hypothetical protein
MGFAKGSAHPGSDFASPTGKSAKSLSSPLAKNIPLYRFLETSLEAAPSRPGRGAYASSRTLGTGCGGRGSVGALEIAGRASARERLDGARTNDACSGRRSRVVLTPRRWRQVLRRHVGPTGRRQTFNPRDDGDKKARSPRRARSKPLKPLCRECRVRFRCTCGD